MDYTYRERRGEAIYRFKGGMRPCTNARLPVMPDITGLGSVAAAPMHSVDSVRTVFHLREVFSFGPHTHHEPVGRRVATIDLHSAPGPAARLHSRSPGAAVARLASCFVFPAALGC